jgi:hypothetical protein
MGPTLSCCGFLQKCAMHIVEAPFCSCFWHLTHDTGRTGSSVGSDDKVEREQHERDCSQSCHRSAHRDHEYWTRGNRGACQRRHQLVALDPLTQTMLD